MKTKIKLIISEDDENGVIKENQIITQLKSGLINLIHQNV